MPNLLKKKPIEIKSILWTIHNNLDLNEYIPLPKDGRVLFKLNFSMPSSYWSAIGYICINKLAIRVDVFEKIFYLARKKIKSGPFLESADLMNPIGCNSAELKDIMSFCGYEGINLGNEKILYFFRYNKSSKFKKTKSVTKQKRNKQKTKVDPNSPFAVLEKLL